MMIKEKCDCGGELMWDSDTDKKKEWKFWKDEHAECINPRPKVTGTDASTQVRTRTQEVGTWGHRTPITNARSLPFGFVPNEENEKYL